MEFFRSLLEKQLSGFVTLIPFLLLRENRHLPAKSEA
jgi:hypothetical protein